MTYAYDTLGHIVDLKSEGYADNLNGTWSIPDNDPLWKTVNRVSRTYDGYGGLLSDMQDQDGDGAGVGDTVTYKYDYANGRDRLASLSLSRDDTTTVYNYASGLDSNISRVSEVSDGTTALEWGYQYMGASAVAGFSRLGSYLKPVELDSSGRIAGLEWTATSSAKRLSRMTYQYDKDGNPIARHEYFAKSTGNSEAGFDQVAHYDMHNVPDSYTFNGNLSSWGVDSDGNRATLSTSASSKYGTKPEQTQAAQLSWEAGFENVPLAPGSKNVDMVAGIRYDAWGRAVQIRNIKLNYDGLGRVTRQENFESESIYAYAGGAQILDYRFVKSDSHWETRRSVRALDGRLIAQDRRSDPAATTPAGAGNDFLYSVTDADGRTTALVTAGAVVAGRFLFDLDG